MEEGVKSKGTERIVDGLGAFSCNLGTPLCITHKACNRHMTSHTMPIDINPLVTRAI